MKYGLGIDTGGTYTDAVIYDFEAKSVLAYAKAVTVKEDLSEGIINALDRLPSEILMQVRLVSLSTTLATNACVEGKGGRARLVLIGCDRKSVELCGSEYGLPAADEIIFLDGGLSHKGEIVAEPDWDKLKAAVQSGERVDAYAVVALWGTRNPALEKRAKSYIYEWTGSRTVCGHELSSELNSLRRAASALLNAQLIPVINDFLSAVKTSMRKKGISAPVVIVRGDGSMMNEQYAREMPVETLICGPAASIAGGIALSNLKDCIVVDMGGTTSDMAVVRNGLPKLAEEGASVGKWRTGVRSVMIDTIGLGGDSSISYDKENRLVIGPARCAPLSWAASRWPRVLDKIRLMHSEKKRHSVPLCQFFYLVKDISDSDEKEKRIIAALKDGPKSIAELAEAAGSSVYSLGSERLERLGAIMRCGLTPTDIMHITGEFEAFSSEAAHLSAELLAFQLGIELDTLAKRVIDGVKFGLYQNIVRMMLDDELPAAAKGDVHGLIAAAYEQAKSGADGFLSVNFKLSVPLVGVGAPIHIFLPDVAKALGTKCIIPPHASVANAIGAVTGNVVTDVSISIRPLYSAGGVYGYLACGFAGARQFKTLDEAVDWAKENAKAAAHEQALQRGAEDTEATVTVKHTEAEISADAVEREGGAQTGEQGRLLIETVVKAVCVGKIKWA